jgi:hypothetical protein
MPVKRLAIICYSLEFELILSHKGCKNVIEKIIMNNLKRQLRSFGGFLLTSIVAFLLQVGMSAMIHFYASTNIWWFLTIIAAIYILLKLTYYLIMVPMHLISHRAWLIVTGVAIFLMSLYYIIFLWQTLARLSMSASLLVSIFYLTYFFSVIRAFRYQYTMNMTFDDWINEGVRQVGKREK